MTRLTLLGVFSYFFYFLKNILFIGKKYRKRVKHVKCVKNPSDFLSCFVERKKTRPNQEIKADKRGNDLRKLTPLQSIRKECLYCMGGSSKLVADCETITCVLRMYRTGRIEPGADRRLLRVIRSFCLQCVGTSDEVRKCTGKMIDGTVCNLHSYRIGKRLPNHGQEANLTSNFNECALA